MKKIYNFKMRIILAVTFLISSIGAMAQVDVVATGGLPVASYTTLNAAFAAINAGTHTGNIAIGISANTTEVGACVLNSSGAGAASYTAIGISPTVDGVSISGPTTTGRGLIELNGADNVTIDGDNPNSAGTNRDLSLINTAANTITYTSVVRIALSTLITSGNSDVVRNCIITGSATGRNIATATSTTGSEHTTYGILVGGGASITTVTTAPSAITSVSTTIGAGITATSFTADNNMLDACARGIAVQGSAATVALNLTVTNNIIGSATAGNTTTVYSRGVTLQGFDNALIAGNAIRNIEYFVGTAQMGISLGDVSASGTNSIVEKNTITGVYNKATGTFGAYGINIAAGANITVRNNFVAGITGDMSGGGAFSTTFGIFGIRISTSTGHKIYNNSVNLSGLRSGTATSSLLAASFAIVGTGSTGLDVRNNIFANTLTGGTTSIAYVSVYLPSGGTSAMNLILNNNAYYAGSDAARQGILQVSTTASVANLYLASNFIPGATAPATNSRSYTSTLSVAGTNDNASYGSTNAAPFISSANLHLDLASSELTNVEQKGDASVSVTADIDGDVRPNALTTIPDMGADEVAVAICSSANGGTITPSTYSKCNGQTVSLASTGVSTGTGIAYQWQVSTTSGGPYSNVSGGTGATTTSYTSGALVAGTYYYVLQTTCSAGPLTGLSNEVTVTVNGLPTVTVSPTTGSICQPGGIAVALTGSGAVTYGWLPAAGLSAITGTSVNALPFATTTYTVTGVDVNGCTATATTVISVSENPGISMTTATPASVCFGGNSQLVATAGLTTSYAVTNIPFAPIATPGSGVTTLCNAGTATTVLSSGTLDDGGWMNQSIPFSFQYFGVTYSSFAVSTNGFITLGTGAPTTYTGYYNTFPNTAAARTSLGPIYSDLDFRTVGTINYFVSGTAPNRMFVINWSNGNFYNAVGALNGQLIIYESSNAIEMHITNSTGTNAAVEGIQNTAGTTAYTAIGRNNVNWTVSTPDAYRFAPNGGPLTYSWSPATFLASTTVANPMANGITATTTYTLTVTSLSGCSAQNTVTVTANPIPTATATATPVACNGGTSAVTITATGGTPVYTGTGTFTQAAGTVVYTVTDVNSCTSTASVVVTEPTAVTVTPTSTPVLCNGGTSTVTIAATGGTGTLTGTGTFTQAAGTTVYTVTDANSCTGTASVVITEPAVITVTPTSTAILCNGGTSTVTIAATGGTGTLTGTGTFTQAAGTTVYTVTDANSCTGTASVVTTEPTALVASSSTTAPILCNGAMGTVTVSATGGTPSYTGTGAFPQAVGSSTYTITDANGCTATTSTTLTEPSAIVISYSETGVLCNGGTSAVTIVATGGTPGYLGQGTFTQSAGITTYTITDANACSASLAVTVVEPAALTTASSVTSTILCNGGTGTVDITATGGTIPYSGDGSMIQSAGSTVYTVTDANGCTSTTTVTLTEPTAVMVMFSSTPILCNGGSSSVTISGMDGTPGYIGEGTFPQFAGTTTYTITDANGCVGAANVAVTQPAAITTAQSINLCAGQSVTVGTNTYTTAGTYTDVLVAANTCDSTVTTTVTTTTIDATTTVSGATITANSATGAFQWLDCNLASAPIAGETNQIYTAIADGSYAVQVTDNGCVDTSACVNIIGTGIANNTENVLSVYPNPTMGIFNIAISNAAISELVITIVDIQGKEVFSSMDKNVNGTFNKQINLEEISKGLYYIKVNTGAEVKIQKLVIQ